MKRSLSEAQRDFITLVETLGEGLVVHSGTGEIIYYNQASLKILGITGDQLMGRTSFDPRWCSIDKDGNSLSGDQHPGMICLRTGVPQRNFVMGVQKPDGSLRWVDINCSPVFEGNTKKVIAVYATFIDVTENRNLKTEVEKSDSKIKVFETELKQSSKLSSIGELSAGIVHEINNPLTVIEMETRNLIRTLDKNSSIDVKKFSDKLKKIELMTKRIGKIATGVLRFSRKDSSTPLEVQTIGNVIDETVMLCEYRLKKSGVKLQMERSGAETLVKMNGIEISQVVLNILNNATDACKDSEQKWIKIELSNLGNKLQVAISNSGSLISKDVASKIFEPFFTTKRAGSGTGLGLSISKKIIEAHAGRLFIDEKSDVTKFVIELPIFKEDSKKSAA
jgi:PAS domain S-box-containing protein